MPFADLNALEKDTQLDHLGDVFTVSLITRYLQGRPEAGNNQEHAPEQNG
jgi:hypothetical protein